MEKNIRNHISFVSWAAQQDCLELEWFRAPASPLLEFLIAQLIG